MKTIISNIPDEVIVSMLTTAFVLLAFVLVVATIRFFRRDKVKHN